MSLVLELQAMAQDGKTDVVELVRRALVVATKLKLSEFASWLNLELAGYPTEASVPPYRRVPSVLVSHSRFHGTHPVQWPDPGHWVGEASNLYNHFAEAPLWQSVGTLSALLSGSSKSLQVPLNPAELDFVRNGTGRPPAVEFSRQLPSSSVHGALHAVRNEILRWSLQLEESGILGEGMTFSQKEQTVAKESQTIHNYGLMIQGNNASAAQAQNSPNAAVSAAQAGDALSRLESLHQALASASPELAPLVKDLASALRADKELTAPQKDEAADQLVALAQQVLAAPPQRTPSVSRMIGRSLRELLSLSADVFQVWGSAAPVFAHLLGLPI